MKIKIVNDNAQPIIFVGKTSLNREWYLHVKGERECSLISLEELESESEEKLAGCQYFVSAGYTGFKKKIIETIQRRVPDANFVTLIHETASISNDCHIGVGVSIGPYVYVGPDSVIGDYTNIEISAVVGHSGNRIGKLVFLGPHSIVTISNLADGTWLGAYSKLDTVNTMEYQQFKAHTRCFGKTFKESGTYFHGRLQDSKTSLESDINM
jgi:NDP-sugar pyrophosphorylase family protein